MIRTQSVTLALAVTILGCLLLSSAASAQPQDAQGQIVLDVKVRGNDRMSDDAVLANVRTRPGSRYSDDIARDDQRRLYETGRFDNVVVLKAPTADGLLVTFVVTERQLIAKLILRGAKSISEKKIREALDFGADDPLDVGRVSLGRMAIEDLYKSEGYYFASVTLDQIALRERQQVVFNIVEGPRIRVRSLELVFEDTESISKRKIRSKIKTKKAFWFLSRGKLDPQQLDQDVASVESFYRDEGYLDVTVTREVTFTPDKKSADVKFIVNEGPRYTVAEIRILGNTVFADEELTGRLKMLPGRYRTLEELRHDLKAITDAYGEIGYIDADVDTQTVYKSPVDEDGKPAAELILIYKLEEGEQFRVGRVTIRGNQITKDRVIRRQVTMYPGQWFNMVALEGSKQAIEESTVLGAGGSATITPYGNAVDLRNVLIDVAEGNTARLSIGAGYSSNDGVLGHFSYTQQNFSWSTWPTSFNDMFRGRGFKGDGQRFEFNIEPGSEVGRARIHWREPYLFDRAISLGIGGYAYTREQENYDENAVGAVVSLGKMFKNRWYGELAVRPEGNRIDGIDEGSFVTINVTDPNDPPTPDPPNTITRRVGGAPSEVLADAGSHFTVDFQGTLVRDRTNSRWQPSKGDRLTLTAQPFVGDDQFTRMGINYAKYFTLYTDALERKHILSARARADFITGDAPVYEKFYAGGVGTLRGFKYRGVSPRSKDAGNDDPVGGDFISMLGAEYSFPLATKNLRGVLFCDSGTVERNVTIDTWRVSVGFGIRMYVPYMGPVPISLDFGFPLKKTKEDDTQLVGFMLGWNY